MDIQFCESVWGNVPKHKSPEDPNLVNSGGALGHEQTLKVRLQAIILAALFDRILCTKILVKMQDKQKDRIFPSHQKHRRLK